MSINTERLDGLIFPLLSISQARSVDSDRLDWWNRPENDIVIVEHTDDGDTLDFPTLEAALESDTKRVKAKEKSGPSTYLVKVSNLIIVTHKLPSLEDGLTVGMIDLNYHFGLPTLVTDDMTLDGAIDPYDLAYRTCLEEASKNHDEEKISIRLKTLAIEADRLDAYYTMRDNWAPPPQTGWVYTKTVNVGEHGAASQTYLLRCPTRRATSFDLDVKLFTLHRDGEVQVEIEKFDIPKITDFEQGLDRIAEYFELMAKTIRERKEVSKPTNLTVYAK